MVVPEGEEDVSELFTARRHELVALCMIESSEDCPYPKKEMWEPA
jgi:hypothetical protein